MSRLVEIGKPGKLNKVQICALLFDAFLVNAVIYSHCFFKHFFGLHYQGSPRKSGKVLN
jgi:hypothetical protein